VERTSTGPLSIRIDAANERLRSCSTTFLDLEHISGAVCSFAAGHAVLSIAKLLKFASSLEPLYSVALQEECAFKFCIISASAGTIPFQRRGPSLALVQI
jgi:hypothetical protein